MSERLLILDTETTGLEPANEHRVVEIGILELVNRRVTGEWQRYLNPDRRSDDRALEIHGLTHEFLSDKPRFRQVADDLVAMLRDREIVIHNASFDVGFLDREFERMGRPERVSQLGRVTDSLDLARKLYFGQKNDLESLCKRLSIDLSHRQFHGALLDAKLLAEAYLVMTGGQTALSLEGPADELATTPVEIALAELFSGTPPPLRVVRATEEELEAHRKRLAEIAKKGGLIWKDEI